MDAKVLRAAVSAAIRVTVSTALIGCGNTTSNETAPSETGGDANDAANSGGGGAGSAQGTIGAGVQQAGTGLEAAGTAANSGGGASSWSGGQPSSEPDGGGTAPSGAVGSGVVSGGASAGGQASGGSEAEAGGGQKACGANVLDCFSVLQAVERGAPLSETGNACCVSVRQSLVELRQADSECYNQLRLRFEATPARQACCKDPSTWAEPACTPWGPPVPPGLPPEFLQSWAAVA